MRAMMQMMVMLPLKMTIFKWSITIIFIKALIDPESWMEQDLAPSSFLGGWEHDEDDGHEFDSSAHLLWIRYTLMMHHLSWHQTWVAMLIYHEFDASAHCFLLLGAFDDDAIDWLLLNESQLQAASMSQSTFKHTSAAAIFFPSAWRFIWVLCQTLPRASQPVGWLRGSVKGLALLHEGSRKFYANPFPKLASLKTSDWSGLGRDGFWGTHHGISINIWCKLEKHQLVKDILARCMNVDETRRRSCVDLWMGLEDMRGVSEKAAAEHCGWDLICGRGPRKGYNQKKIHGPHDMFPRLPLDLMWFDLANPMGHH